MPQEKRLKYMEDVKEFLETLSMLTPVDMVEIESTKYGKKVAKSVPRARRMHITIRNKDKEGPQDERVSKLVKKLKERDKEV